MDGWHNQPRSWPQEQPCLSSARITWTRTARLSQGRSPCSKPADAFRMPVYPGHREFAYYRSSTRGALQRRTRPVGERQRGIPALSVAPGVCVSAEQRSETICRFTHTTGAFETMDGNTATVFPNGTRSTRHSRFLQESPYASRSNPITAEYEYRNWASTPVIS